ncbi:hypothetical protein TWF506_006856 [Arthrobotrys conoides]|uniref:Uncharacterized protein n=1 Tax=Arthrobotrys conoides TaxID=74498 RepID=A0AAN8S1K1_9PEZI
MGMLQVASSVIKHKPDTPTGTTDSKTLMMSMHTRASTISTYTTPSPSTSTSLALLDFTTASDDIEPTVEDVSTNTPELSAIETLISIANVKTRNEYLTPSFFYSEPLKVQCRKSPAWIIEHLIIPFATGEKSLHSYKDQFDLNANQITILTHSITQAYKDFVSRGSKDGLTTRYDATFREWVSRQTASCRGTIGCRCDQDTGKVITNTEIKERTKNKCKLLWRAAECTLVLGCLCETILRQPVLGDINFPAILDDFRHAINDIPQSVILAGGNQGWSWNVPLEITDGEAVTIRPGDPVPERTNIAPPGQPPFWLYGPPRNRNLGLSHLGVDEPEPERLRIDPILQAWSFINYFADPPDKRPPGTRRDVSGQGHRDIDYSQADLHLPEPILLIQDNPATNNTLYLTSVIYDIPRIVFYLWLWV